MGVIEPGFISLIPKMSVSTKCEVCNEAEFRYRCPRCLRRICSLACSREHKKLYSCSGVANAATDYVGSKDLKDADTRDEKNHLVQRDYNFLVNMNRQLSLLKEDGKVKSKRVFSVRGNNGNWNESNQNRYNVSKARHVMRRGVKCLLLPKGMQRSVSNKSKWDKPLDTFVWSLEWVLINEQGEPWSHISHRNKEEACVVNCVGKQVYDRCMELYDLKAQEHSLDREEDTKTTKEDRSKQILDFGLKFYTKCFPSELDMVMDTKVVTEINPSECVGQVFKDRTVIEFPTVFIVPDFKKLREKGYLLESEHINGEQGNISGTTNGAVSNESSEQDSSSDEETSSSDSSSEYSSESSSDESSDEPEEESAKQSSTSDDYNPGVNLDFLTA